MRGNLPLALAPVRGNNLLAMGQALSDHETVAGVLMMLVRQRAASSGAGKTSRTGLTAKGKLFLAHVQRARGETPTAYEHNDKSPAMLAAVLQAIDAEERLRPQGPIDDLRTLPARLDGYRAERPSRFSRAKGLLVVGGVAAAVAAFRLLR